MSPTALPAATRSKSTSDSSRASRRLDRHHLANLVDFEYHIALLVHMECGSEPRAPGDLVIAIRISRVHRLAERVVESLDEDQDLGLQLLQIGCRLSVDRALLIDRMHDRPCQREKVNGGPFQFE